MPVVRPALGRMGPDSTESGVMYWSWAFQVRCLELGLLHRLTLVPVIPVILANCDLLDHHTFA